MISDNIVYFLPRNADMEQVRQEVVRGTWCIEEGAALG